MAAGEGQSVYQRLHEAARGDWCPLSPILPAVSGGLNPDTIAANVRALVNADRTGRVDASYTIFAMLSIELWCRSFVDPRVPRELSILPGL